MGVGGRSGAADRAGGVKGRETESVLRGEGNRGIALAGAVAEFCGSCPTAPVLV